MVITLGYLLSKNGSLSKNKIKRIYYRSWQTKTVLSAWAIVTVECPWVLCCQGGCDDSVAGGEERLPASGRHQRSQIWFMIVNSWSKHPRIPTYIHTLPPSKKKKVFRTEQWIWRREELDWLVVCSVWVSVRFVVLPVYSKQDGETRKGEELKILAGGWGVGAGWVVGETRYARSLLSQTWWGVGGGG